MEGGGFFHVELYGRQSGAGTTKTTSGAVISEAMREDGFTSHIDSPEPPDLLYGVTPAAAYAESLLRLEGEKDASGRKIKCTATILLAGVASYPKPIEAMLTTDDWEEYDKWVNLNLAFLKEQWGDDLKSVLQHTDETYPHIHFYVIAEKPQLTRNLHPGKVAEIRAPAGGGKAAFKKAMSELQDKYYEKVSFFCGHLRLGPRSQRLSRGEWKMQKANAAYMATVASATISDQKTRLARIAEAEEKLNKALDDVTTKNKKLKDEAMNYRKVLRIEFENLMEEAIEVRDYFKQKLGTLLKKHPELKEAETRIDVRMDMQADAYKNRKKL